MLPGPGPIDCWLCANCSPERAMEQPLVEGEVRCTVVVQLEKVGILGPQTEQAGLMTYRQHRTTVLLSIRIHTHCI